MPDRSSSMLALVVTAPALPGARPAISTALGINVSVDVVIRMPLRAVRLLCPRVDRTVTCRVTSGRHSSKVGRVAASTVRAFLATTAFRRIVADVVQNQPFRNFAIRQFVRNGVRFACQAIDVEGTVALGEGAVPGPALVRGASVDERVVSLHGRAGCRASAPSIDGTVSTQAQVVRVAQPELLHMSRPYTFGNTAYLL